MNKEYKPINLPHLPGTVTHSTGHDTIVKSDDPLGIDGKKVTDKNIKTVLKNILKIYKR